MRQSHKIKICIFSVTILTFLCLLVVIFFTDRVSVTQTRSETGFTEVQNITETEEMQEGTPIGIRKEYTFILDDDIPHDTSLAFYTVHQYVTVYLDGEKIYDLQPSEGYRVTKTVGSNWVMIPLYSEDCGKEVRVEITPVYQSFRNREVQFYIGSPLAVYQSRLMKDLPQIILGSAAILVGITFTGVAGYSLLKKHYGKRLAVLGLFSVMLGLWKLNDTRFTPFMDGGHPVLIYYLAITMPMLGMLPLMQWTRESFSERGRKVIDVYEVGIAILCLLQLGVQWFGLYDLRESMVVTHAAIAVGAVLLISLVIMDRRRNEGRGKMTLQLGLVFLCVAGILGDVAAFYIKGNSSGLLFSLMAFIVYIIAMGIHTMSEYGRQQIEIAQLDRELAEKERSLTDSRIKVMMSQIRTHFIFNVLTTISTYCKIDPKTADQALVRFSRYLRRNIRIIEEDGLIDFDSELEQLEDYVALEQLRFAERIIFKKNIEISSFQIPPLTVQPIVENAIKHGFVEQGKSGTVFLHTERKENTIIITVKDDGSGFDPEMLEATDSVGIRNVRCRLESMVGGTLTVESSSQGTIVTMRIPQKEEN